MKQHQLGDMEQKFAELIWQLEPISSGELVKQCEGSFGWKKSTTYTMLKRLCERDIFLNQRGIVKAVLSKEEFQAMQGEMFLKETFDGSLPRFVAAFTRRKKLSIQEVKELKKLIDEYQEE